MGIVILKCYVHRPNEHQTFPAEHSGSISLQEGSDALNLILVLEKTPPPGYLQETGEAGKVQPLFKDWLSGSKL